MFLSLVLLLPSMTCFFGAMGLCMRFKSNSASHNILAILAFAASAILYIEANYVSGITGYMEYFMFDVADSFLRLSILPLVYFYFRALTSTQYRHKLDFVWFVPAIVVGSCSAVCYYAMGMDNAVLYAKSLFDDSYNFDTSISSVYYYYHLICVIFYNWALLVQSIIVLIYAIASVVIYNNRLGDFYSDLESKSVRNTYTILIFAIISLCFSAAFTIVGRYYWAQHQGGAMIFFAFWAIPYFMWIYNAYTAVYDAEEFECDLTDSDTRNPVGSTSEVCQTDSVDLLAADTTGDNAVSSKFATLRISLDDLMLNRRLYLQNSLRIDEVACELGSNRTYISSLIKHEFGCNFSEYINWLRIDYSKTYILENQNMTHEYIAYNCGFVTVSSFYRAFRRYVGVSPRNWLLKHSLQADL